MDGVKGTGLLAGPQAQTAVSAAQFAAAGHPLLGDGKYGSERQNKRYGRSYQALYSYRLEFCFTTDAGALAPLDGQQFQVEQVDFVTEYFPGFSL